MQDEIWHQFSIQNYNGAALSVYSAVLIVINRFNNHIDRLFILRFIVLKFLKRIYTWNEITRMKINKIKVNVGLI